MESSSLKEEEDDNRSFYMALLYTEIIARNLFA